MWCCSTTFLSVNSNMSLELCHMDGKLNLYYLYFHIQDADHGGLAELPQVVQLG